MPTVSGAGTTSRYAGVSGIPDATDSRTASSGSSTGTVSTTGTQVGTTNQTQTQSGSSKTTNMSAQDQAQLDLLIKQLMSGGTPEMKAALAARNSEMGTVASIRDGYSKQAAFNDSQGLVSQQMRRALESLLPSINRAAEDAGSSGGALRALLLQDAANKAAESSSALGVQTAVQYGGVSSNLSQVMERLTQPDSTVANALIGAFQASKGATSSTVSNGTTNTVGTSTQQTAQNQTSATQENKSTSVDYAPFAVTSGGYGTSGGGLNAFGAPPAVDPGKYVGTTADTLAQLAGTGSPWNSYKF